MGVDAVGSTKLTLDYQFTIYQAYDIIFGARNGSLTADQFWFSLSSPVTAGYLIGYGTKYGGTSYFASAVDYNRHSLIADNNSWTLDGSAPVVASDSSAQSSSLNLYLGAVNQAGAAHLASNTFRGKVYSLTIDKDDAANDRNFVPARCDEETCSNTNTGAPASLGEYGLYDTLHDMFYRATAGTFSGGEAVDQDPPTVSSITPNSGSTDGGYPIEIIGTGFIGAVVTIGGVSISCTIHDNQRMTCIMPNVSGAGAVDVVIDGFMGGSLTVTDGFTYLDPATVGSVSPHYFAADSSGQTLTINSLPSDFVEVEYLDFTGTQYIDMGVDAVGSTKLTLDYQLTAYQNFDLIFGARNGNLTADQFWFSLSSPATAGYIIGYGTQYGGTNYFASAVDYNRHSLIADNNSWTLDGSAPFTGSGSSAQSSSLNLYLGTVNQAGAAILSAMLKGKVYSLTIDKDNAANDRNFVPARCNKTSGCARTNTGVAASYGEYGMYDTLHNVFYRAAAGTFGGGNNVGILALTAVDEVRIGGASAAFTVVGNSLMVTVPNRGVSAAGVAVEVVVGGVSRTVGQVHFLRVTGPSPASGSSLGGDVVTVGGSGFDGLSPVVAVGGAVASDVTVVDDGTLTFETPAHSAGVVDVVISGLNGESVTLTNAWEYQFVPSITLTLDKTDINLIASPNGGIVTDYLTANVITNNPNGYNLSIEASQPDLKCVSGSNTYTIPALTSTFQSPTAMTDNRWGYNIGSTTPTTWAGITSSAELIDSFNTTTDPDDGRDTIIWFGTQVNFSQPACSDYATTITITVVGGS
jgi:hypothetical protein